MKYLITAAILLFALTASAQVDDQWRMVGSIDGSGWTVVDDSTYTGNVNFQSDLTSKGFLATDIDSGYHVFTQISQMYRVDSVLGTTFSSAEIRIIENGSDYGTPTGQVMAYDPQGRQTVPQAPLGSTGSTNAMQAAVVSWNSRATAGSPTDSIYVQSVAGDSATLAEANAKAYADGLVFSTGDYRAIDTTVTANSTIPLANQVNVLSIVHTGDIVITLPKPVDSIKGNVVTIQHLDTTAANLGTTQIQTDFIDYDLYDTDTLLNYNLFNSGEFVSFRVSSVNGVLRWKVVNRSYLAVGSDTPSRAGLRIDEDGRGYIKNSSESRVIDEKDYQTFSFVAQNIDSSLIKSILTNRKKAKIVLNLPDSVTQNYDIRLPNQLSNALQIAVEDKSSEYHYAISGEDLFIDGYTSDTIFLSDSEIASITTFNNNTEVHFIAKANEYFTTNQTVDGKALYLVSSADVDGVNISAVKNRFAVGKNLIYRSNNYYENTMTFKDGVTAGIVTGVTGSTSIFTASIEQSAFDSLEYITTTVRIKGKANSNAELKVRSQRSADLNIGFKRILKAVDIDSSNFKDISITFQLNESAKDDINFEYRFEDLVSTDTIYVAGFKMEKGQKPTYFYDTYDDSHLFARGGNNLLFVEPENRKQIFDTLPFPNKYFNGQIIDIDYFYLPDHNDAQKMQYVLDYCGETGKCGGVSYSRDINIDTTIFIKYNGLEIKGSKIFTWNNTFSDTSLSVIEIVRGTKFARSNIKITDIAFVAKGRAYAVLDKGATRRMVLSGCTFAGQDSIKYGVIDEVPLSLYDNMFSSRFTGFTEAAVKLFRSNYTIFTGVQFDASKTGLVNLSNGVSIIGGGAEFNDSIGIYSSSKLINIFGTYFEGNYFHHIYVDTAESATINGCSFNILNDAISSVYANDVKMIYCTGSRININPTFFASSSLLGRCLIEGNKFNTALGLINQKDILLKKENITVRDNYPLINQTPVLEEIKFDLIQTDTGLVYFSGNLVQDASFIETDIDNSFVTITADADTIIKSTTDTLFLNKIDFKQSFSDGNFIVAAAQVDSGEIYNLSYYAKSTFSDFNLQIPNFKSSKTKVDTVLRRYSYWFKSEINDFLFPIVVNAVSASTADTAYFGGLQITKGKALRPFVQTRGLAITNEYVVINNESVPNIQLKQDSILAPAYADLSIVSSDPDTLTYTADDRENITGWTAEASSHFSYNASNGRLTYSGDTTTVKISYSIDATVGVAGDYRIDVYKNAAGVIRLTDENNYTVVDTKEHSRSAIIDLVDDDYLLFEGKFPGGNQTTDVAIPVGSAIIERIK